jgi:alpha-tubulin suppressor-like RCC1 family protein
VLKTKINEVFAFGLNDKGQLGIGKIGSFCSIPHKLKHLTSFPIIKLSCSEESSSFLTTNGDLYVWGRNTGGMFDSEENGIFALDQAFVEPTLVSNYF